jgi:hypothetical protein
MARAKACPRLSVLMTSWRSVADREVATLRVTLADARQRRTFATDGAQCSRHALLTTAEEQQAVSIKRILVRALQALSAAPSLIAGGFALIAGGKAAGSAWSQHLLEALLIIAVLEWVLRHDWSRPAVRGLTHEEWNQHWASEESHQAFERGTRVLCND